MQRIAKFERVSSSQFEKDFLKNIGGDLSGVYEDISLPKRSTVGSAGYDFSSPCEIVIPPQKSVFIPTGIRAQIENGWVLKIYIRSGLGVKFQLRLDNTVGIIDSDYYFAENEGHIMIKLHNPTNREVVIEKGKGFVQGVFVPFGITVDDDADGQRTGGFGSTDKKR